MQRDASSDLNRRKVPAWGSLCDLYPGSSPPTPGPRTHEGPPSERAFEANRGTTDYLIASYTLNIGMYIATTMNPTMPPTSTIMTGSRIDVSALIAAATSSS